MGGLNTKTRKKVRGIHPLVFTLERKSQAPKYSIIGQKPETQQFNRPGRALRIGFPKDFCRTEALGFRARWLGDHDVCREEGRQGPAIEDPLAKGRDVLIGGHGDFRRVLAAFNLLGWQTGPTRISEVSRIGSSDPNRGLLRIGIALHTQVDSSILQVGFPIEFRQNPLSAPALVQCADRPGHAGDVLDRVPLVGGIQKVLLTDRKSVV